MRYGRLTQTAWQRSVKRQLHNRERDALFGPSPWEECSGIPDESGGGFLWADAHAAGASARTGYYAVLHAAGELAAKGVPASCVSVRVLFPPEAEEEELKAVAAGVEEACGRMGLQVTAFQGETSRAAERIIVFAAVAGKAGRRSIQNIRAALSSRRPESAGHPVFADWKTERKGQKAAAGQEIVFCGYAGLEGMLRILDEAGDELGTRFIPDFLRKAGELTDRLVTPGQILALFRDQERSPDGLAAEQECGPDGAPAAREMTVRKAAQDRDAGRQAGMPGITAVFQAGSGGILAALWEMAETLHIGFEAELSGISVRQETVEICEFYRLNPYQMASSGSFLIVTEDAPGVIEILEKAGARAGRLGVIKAQNARVITSGEEIRYLDRPAPDELELWQARRARHNEDR